MSFIGSHHKFGEPVCSSSRQGKTLLFWLVTSLFFFTVNLEATVEVKPSFEPITLGEFYYECARAFGIQLPEGWEVSDSWRLLRATGLSVRKDADFSQSLRQRHVIEIGSQLGIQFKNDNSDQLFSRKQVESFLIKFRNNFRLPLKKRLEQRGDLPNSEKNSNSKQSDPIQKN